VKKISIWMEVPPEAVLEKSVVASIPQTSEGLLTAGFLKAGDPNPYEPLADLLLELQY
jgi:hypothetical protein